MSWLKKILGKKERSDFHVDLGPAWTAAHEDTHFCFNDEENLRQVTISVLLSKQNIEKPELFMAALDLLRMRRELIEGLSNGQAKISDPVNVDRDGGFDMTISAVDPVNEVQIKTTILARPLRTITVTFNKYSPFLSDEEFEKQAAWVLSKITI
jgi:hypothetical protein